MECGQRVVSSNTYGLWNIKSIIYQFLNVLRIVFHRLLTAGVIQGRFYEIDVVICKSSSKYILMVSING